MSHPLQSSSIDKWIDAPTRRVDAAGATFVYRRLGPARILCTVPVPHSSCLPILIIPMPWR
jgi:hypothetical protein